ncbi:MAG: endolytic transglycosylase MltG [Pseudobutyrivibrio sp.]|nr:endolytic transglycosylase MltG [Pseudobutyrivibrio sp.]
MRLKYYLRGIGIGVIFATLLLSINFYFGENNFTKQELSDDEIIARASELGMIMPEEDTEDADTTEDISDAAETETNAEAATDASLDNNDDTTTEQVPEDVTGEVKEVLESDEAKAVDASDSSADDTVTYVPFTVRGGESSGTVSNNLYKAGLVSSSDDFNQYITGIGMDNRIQAGTFYVKQGSTYDDIVALLVNKEGRTTTPPKEE